MEFWEILGQLISTIGIIIIALPIIFIIWFISTLNSIKNTLKDIRHLLCNDDNFDKPKLKEDKRKNDKNAWDFYNDHIN